MAVAFSVVMLAREIVDRDSEGGEVSQVAFRVCKLLLARRVLWDEDGIAVERMVEMLGATPSLLRQALGDLAGEEWVALDDKMTSAGLTEKGVAALLGRELLAGRIQSRA